MPDYPGNSNKAKKAAPKPEKLIVGKVVQRKKPLGRKIAEFFSPRDISTVVQHVFESTLKPAAKDLAYDALNGLTGGMIYGPDSPARARSRMPHSGATSVTPYYLASSGVSVTNAARDMSRQGRARFNFDEIILASRVEAETVLSGMETILDEYDVVRVADLYAMVDITGQFTDDKFGWFSLAGASVSRSVDPPGYLLNLPKPVSLD